MNKRRVFTKTALMAAALAALLVVTAVASVVGRSRLKNALNANGAQEVADLVQEVHADSGGAVEGFGFSIDEIIWEDRDLYLTCSISVPEGGRYLVAMSTPTLNGKKLDYDAKGWTLPKFVDQEEPRVLLYGGEHPTASTELLTFAVDPALRAWRDARLSFRAVLYGTEKDFPGERDFGGLLDPPESMTLSGDDAGLYLDRLIAEGDAVALDERRVDVALDAAELPQVVYDDVAEHDFDVGDAHIHIDDFRLTHTGVDIEYTVSGAGMAAFLDGEAHMGFCTAEGRELGIVLGVNAGGGRVEQPDGTVAYRIRVETSALIPLKGLDEIVYAPVEYPEDEQGRQMPAVYDLERGIVLTPLERSH